MKKSIPWYHRAVRWGQTNITEIDPKQYDIGWWREHWRRTRIQGVIVNAGGIVAYYPSAFAQHRAEFLGDRDLFGDICNAAREECLAVIARMDCNRVREPFYKDHKDWFAVDKNGAPYQTGEFFFSCVSSPYYDEFIPDILREIIDRYKPDGFGDNSWSGLWSDKICYCENCKRRFYNFCKLPLPEGRDWNSESFRRWVEWSYQRRLEIWDINNSVTQKTGGPDCLWIGMIHGNPAGCAGGFKDIKAVCDRSKFLLLDFQSREPSIGFQDNGDKGMLLNNLLGWDKTIIESMAMYQSPNPTFRIASRPEPEARLWMAEGFAGTIQPWWHHIGAYHDDRRQYETATPMFTWHEKNQEYLINRKPVASVGLVWSQRNIDFFGRDNPHDLAIMPYNGIMQALVRSRIPYVPVHIDDIKRDADNLDVLILPNIGVMTDQQCDAVRSFVKSGKSLLVTGDTSRCDEWGDARADFGLADILGVHSAGSCPTPSTQANPNWDFSGNHTYLRLSPEFRGQVYGPKNGSEPVAINKRHPVLKGFEKTDIIPFGGKLTEVKADPDAIVPFSFIPSFPIYPPETAWMRTRVTDQPGLILRANTSGARIAYLAASIDYCFARDNLPDHGDLLSSIVNWLCPHGFPLIVEGKGLFDCRLYHQPGRMILHIVNLTNPGAWRSPIHELIPAGPLSIKIKLSEGVKGKTTKLLVGGTHQSTKSRDGWVAVDILQVLDHEVVVLE